MEFIPTKFKDVFLIKPQVFHDQRGFFYESYSQRDFEKQGIKIDFVQDNHSLSEKIGTLRGLHFQKPPFEQTKLVRVTNGKIYDVVVDIRKNSATFGQWEGYELSAKNFWQLLVPRGFAHGFETLEENTEVQYKCDQFYHPDADSGIIWNDPDLKINWPIRDIIISEKDSRLPFFKEINY
jgi:dTDP-4-dehydrorhamnose 3,5-epimerase